LPAGRGGFAGPVARFNNRVSPEDRGVGLNGFFLTRVVSAGKTVIEWSNCTA
jgi:hypothetical protein